MVLLGCARQRTIGPRCVIGVGYNDSNVFDSIQVWSKGLRSGTMKDNTGLGLRERFHVASA